MVRQHEGHGCSEVHEKHERLNYDDKESLIRNEKMSFHRLTTKMVPLMRH